MSLPDNPFDAKQPIWFWGFVVLLVLLPLPFGTARFWASDLLGAVTALLLVSALVTIYRKQIVIPQGAPWKRLAVSAGLMAAVMLWALLQMQGWLPCCHAVWDEASTALAIPVRAAISIAPDKFAESAVRMLAYCGCFLLAVIAGRDSGRATIMLKALTFAALVYACYGLAMQSTGLRKILWYDKWAYQDFVTATFVNKNSYATYAALGLQCCLVMLWRKIKRHKIKGARTFKIWLTAWIEQVSHRLSFIVLMIFTVLGALILTGSRGGLAAGLAGCAALFVALAVNRRWNWRVWLAVLLPAFVIVILISGLGAEMFVDRIDGDKLEGDALIRTSAYAVSWRAILARPWTGYGLGAFDNAFRLFRGIDIHEWFEHAHNDYLEMAVELGLPAMGMIVLSLLLMFSCCVEGVWRRQRHEAFPALAVSASVTVGLHSMIDFGMQIPAIAATYVTLLGLGVAQSWSSAKARNGLYD